MKGEEEIIITPAAPAPQQSAPIWGGFIIDILKKWLGFNQLTYGTKKKF